MTFPSLDAGWQPPMVGQSKVGANTQAVTPCMLHSRIDLPQDTGIQDEFRHLAIDQARTDAIAAEVISAYGKGRKVLVLTERTEHRVI